jgi:hypothetical protein
MPDDDARAEAMADILSLTVLRDAPESRGPFLLRTRRMVSDAAATRLRAAWREAFDKAGRPPPVLLILDPDMEIVAFPTRRGVEPQGEHEEDGPCH